MCCANLQICVNRQNGADHRVSRLASRGAFTLVEMLVVIAIIGSLMAMLLPAIQSAQEAGRATACKNNLKNIGLAIIGHADAFNAYPSIPIPLDLKKANGQNGKDGVWDTLGITGHDPKKRVEGKWMGWEVEILRRMDLSSFVEKLVPTLESNDPENLQHLQTSEREYNFFPPSYRCPSARDEFDPVTDDVELMTMNYAVVMGARVPSTYGTDKSVCGPYTVDGIIFPGSRTRPADVELFDGLTSTMMIGERVYFLGDWITSVFVSKDKVCVSHGKNLRYRINSMPPKKGKDADATVDDVLDQRYKVGHFVSDPDASSSNPHPMLYNDLPFASRHPGGSHFLFGGGRVEFISDFIDMEEYYSMGTRNGGSAERTFVNQPD